MLQLPIWGRSGAWPRSGRLVQGGPPAKESGWKVKNIPAFVKGPMAVPLMGQWHLLVDFHENRNGRLRDGG